MDKKTIKEQLEQFTNTDTFWISYYAKKHGKIIKRISENPIDVKS